MATVKTTPSKAQTDRVLHKKSTKATHPKPTPKKNGQEKWDDLLATPESEAFLTLMIAEVRKEEAEGRLIDGGWDEI